MTSSLDQPPLSVLAHFAPDTSGLTWHRVREGFSGARVWRGESAGVARIALKRWPREMTAERLQPIHAWMTQARNLNFVPRVLVNQHGGTVYVEDDRVWDACSWMPGEPRAEPSLPELQAACEAVVMLHGAWSASTTHGPCPGVLNRLRVLTENATLLRAGPEALPPISPQLDPLLRRGVSAAARIAPHLRDALKPWAHRSFALQPCVRDLRGEHVLFEDDHVSGIVDFGAMAVDHPAIDLARLLNDFACNDPARFGSGLNSYSRARGLFDVPDEFIRLLAHSGAVCSVLGWLVRLVVRRDPIGDFAGVSLRLAHLVACVEQFSAE